MTRLTLAAGLVLAAACKSRLPADVQHDFFAAAGLSAVPNIGASVTVGQYFNTRTPKFDWAVELQAVYQGGEDSTEQTGGFAQVSLGVKQVTAPGHSNHLVFRYGATWFRANGRPEVIAHPGDYLGGYAGVGWEYEVSDRITTGPDIRIIIADGEAHAQDPRCSPQASGSAQEQSASSCSDPTGWETGHREVRAHLHHPLSMPHPDTQLLRFSWTPWTLWTLWTSRSRKSLRDKVGR